MVIKTCRSKECDCYPEYKKWMENDDDSMPDNCDRCKRAYPDMFCLSCI